VAPALLPGAGALAYAPAGHLLRGGERLRHPGLETMMVALADEGPGVYYTGWVAERIVDCVSAHGGVVTEKDLSSYAVTATPVQSATLAGHLVFARRDLNNTIGTIAALDSSLAAMSRPERAVALAHALRENGRQKLGDTTNVSVVDHDGNACVITTTLGIGSGLWPEGLGFNLNSMLGEGELITPELVPGGRMSSMMCPLVVVDPDSQLVLAAGASGASRIRTALINTLIGVLVDGLDTGTAIAAPRFHPLAADDGRPGVIHAEPDLARADLAALASAGYTIRHWTAPDAYFGAASAVGLAGAAGDTRRDGVGVTALPPHRD
jgi:gamma-glutamyltranspeptidase/glutathione hydrolase